MLNLRSVDLTLLPVFEAAYEERGLSRAAKARDDAVGREPRPVAAADGVRGRALHPPDERRHPDAGRGAHLRRGALGGAKFDPKSSTRRFFVGMFR